MTFWNIATVGQVFWLVALLVATHQVNNYYKASREWRESLKREKELLNKYAAALKGKEELLNAMMEKSQ
jgi:hypothetical protein